MSTIKSDARSDTAKFTDLLWCHRLEKHNSHLQERMNKSDARLLTFNDRFEHSEAAAAACMAMVEQFDILSNEFDKFRKPVDNVISRHNVDIINNIKMIGSNSKIITELEVKVSKLQANSSAQASNRSSYDVLQRLADLESHKAQSVGFVGQIGEMQKVLDSVIASSQFQAKEIQRLSGELSEAKNELTEAKYSSGLTSLRNAVAPVIQVPGTPHKGGERSSSTESGDLAPAVEQTATRLEDTTRLLLQHKQLSPAPEDRQSATQATTQLDDEQVHDSDSSADLDLLRHTPRRPSTVLERSPHKRQKLCSNMPILQAQESAPLKPSVNRMPPVIRRSKIITLKYTQQESVVSSSLTERVNGRSAKPPTDRQRDKSRASHVKATPAHALPSGPQKLASGQIPPNQSLSKYHTRRARRITNLLEIGRDGKLSQRQPLAQELSLQDSENAIPAPASARASAVAPTIPSSRGSKPKQPQKLRTRPRRKPPI